MNESEIMRLAKGSIETVYSCRGSNLEDFVIREFEDSGMGEMNSQTHSLSRCPLVVNRIGQS